jgi:hypothetical protein
MPAGDIAPHVVPAVLPTVSLKSVTGTGPFRIRYEVVNPRSDSILVVAPSDPSFILDVSACSLEASTDFVTGDNINYFDFSPPLETIGPGASATYEVEFDPASTGYHFCAHPHVSVSLSCLIGDAALELPERHGVVLLDYLRRRQFMISTKRVQH